MISRDNISEKIINLENNQRQKKDIKFLKPEKPNIYEIKYNKYSGSKENRLSAVIYIYIHISLKIFLHVDCFLACAAFSYRYFVNAFSRYAYDRKCIKNK